MIKKKFTVNDFALQAMIAAVYVAITYIAYPLSFGSPQIRISEFMLILIFFNPKHSIGLLVGCAIANFLGEFAIIDMFFGTMASAIAIFLMLKTKNQLLAFLWPAIINGVIIGLELHFLIGLPLFLTMGEVFIGEFLATFVPAMFLLKPLKENPTLRRLFA